MIPKLDVKRLLAEKKYAGDLSFDFEAEQDLLEIPFAEIVSPVRALLSFAILEDNSVEIKGKLVFTLKGLCSRCLKETEREYEGEAEGYFVPSGGKGEDGDYPYSGGMIDLREFLRDALAFSLPASLLCGENCTAPGYKED